VRNNKKFCAEKASAQSAQSAQSEKEHRSPIKNSPLSVLLLKRVLNLQL